MDTNKVFLDLKNKFPNLEIYQNHSLASYTTVKIGGPADIFIHTYNSDEFLSVLKYINEAEATIFGENEVTILGNGSNVLISDSGIRGIVIKNDSQEVELLPENKIKVSSGTQLSYLINFTLDHDLIGLEEFAYIPSTIGGAIAGNIHGINGNFSDYVDSVKKYDNFIISANLNLKSGDSAPAKAKVIEVIQRKSAIQAMNSLGSVFKNPKAEDCIPVWGEKKAAGYILDSDLKLKGKSIGDAQISPKHANFIINNGSTTAKDYLALINLIQSQMQAKFGFQLELEIKLLGQF